MFWHGCQERALAPAIPSSLVALQLKTSSEEKPRSLRSLKNNGCALKMVFIVFVFIITS
jgi:hypothetical protein